MSAREPRRHTLPTSSHARSPRRPSHTLIDSQTPSPIHSTDVEDIDDGILLPAVTDGGATYAFGVRRPPPIDTNFAFGAVPPPFCVPGHVRPACTPACPSAAQSSSAASTDYDCEYEGADDGDLDAAAGAGRRLAAGCYGAPSREAAGGGGGHPMGWRVSLAIQPPGASGAPHGRSYPSPMQ